MALQTLINHVALVVDESASMAQHSDTVVRVFDREIESLKNRSVELDQETRISLYVFNDTTKVLTFDMDVMRFTTLKDLYHANGNTALLDATAHAIEDHKKIPEMYGDHAFLLYVITDGQENRSASYTPSQLRRLLGNLKDNWTAAILVPDGLGERYAMQYGFNAGSISQWDISTARGVENVGKQFSRTMDSFFSMRQSGVRGTKGLFTLNTSNISKSALREVPQTEYEIFPVHNEDNIKHYVESWTRRPYRLGSAYYQPVKTVKIQDHKNILVQDAKNGKVYEGANLRQLLGLPSDTAEVNPGQHKDWRVLVQSTSVNRKLFPNTFVLVRN